MRNRIAAAAAAGILTIGMAVLPSAASASEVAPSTDGLAGSTAISGQIDQDMAVCTDQACEAVQHLNKTNQQIKSDMETAKQHAEQLHQNAHEDADALRQYGEQLHQNAHEDADALRQYGEQAWKNYQEDREDIKNAIDGAVKRGQERHDALHQDMQDTQAHLNQMHADMKETYDELKTRHDAFAASSHQWHQSFIAALKDANSKTGQQGGSSVATGTHGITAGTNAGTTVTGVNGTTGTVRTAADTGANGAATGSVTASGDQTVASTGALTKSEYGQLAQTGIGISLACAAILLLAGLAYAMKTFVQYKRETSED